MSFTWLTRWSLSARIFVGLGLGIAVGLFFGERAAVLQPIADVYIRLMQMTVLPYLVLSLIVGFGQLDPSRARRLALYAGALLLLVWAVVGVVIVTAPLAFPEKESASFFSHSLVEPRKPFPVADLYFTSNPFHSMANAVVPAVVLFSSLVGIFLVGVEGRERVIEALRTLNRSIERITHFIIRLTPIGVFGIGAVAAGTMPLETFERLEVYFLVFALVSLLLTFWVLPLLVTALTPFRYGEVVGAARDALVTAFATNNAFIVLPVLVGRSKALLRKHHLLDEESASSADILIPVLFNFPNAGRLLTLLFIPFAAWLSGSMLPVADYPRLIAVGIPTYFAKAQVAIPFLLDVFTLPHDLFQLYIPTSILNGKFDSMVAAMNLFVFALIGSAAMGGSVRVSRGRVLRAVAATLGGVSLVVATARVLASIVVGGDYDADEVIRRMHASRDHGGAIVHRDLSSVDRPDAHPDGVLARARERGTLRLGFDPGNLPFSFFNADSALVGLDVELACDLADALGLTPEFVPVSWPDLPGMLADGLIDVMPSMWVRPYWFGSLRLSTPYLTCTAGLLVRDERRHQFQTLDTIRGQRDLRIGVPLGVTQLASAVERYFGGTGAEFVTLPTGRAFVERDGLGLDAALIPAESGAAVTLLHPEYSVVVPQPDPVRIPFAFGVALDADPLLMVVDEWVVFAESDGRIARAYDYWVLGEGARPTGGRWSIARDVLGWID